MVYGGAKEWVWGNTNGSGPDDDIIYGGPNTDTILGQYGNDIIYAHHGLDLLDGGPGDDVLVSGLEYGGSVTGGNGSDVAVMINGAMNAWNAGSEPSSVPVYSPKKLPVGFSIPINSTDPKKMISASVLKDRIGVTTSGNVCICDPQDKTL